MMLCAEPSGAVGSRVQYEARFLKRQLLSPMSVGKQFCVILWGEHLPSNGAHHKSDVCE